VGTGCPALHVTRRGSEEKNKEEESSPNRFNTRTQPIGKNEGTIKARPRVLLPEKAPTPGSPAGPHGPTLLLEIIGGPSTSPRPRSAVRPARACARLKRAPPDQSCTDRRARDSGRNCSRPRRTPALVLGPFLRWTNMPSNDADRRSPTGITTRKARRDETAFRLRPLRRFRGRAWRGGE
jgi:hypothetical protein